MLRVTARNAPRAVLSLLAIAALLLTMLLYDPGRTDLWQETLLNTLHLPLFGLIALCLLAATRAIGIKSRERRLVVTLGVAVIISVFTEMMQIGTDRDASLADLMLDWMGILSFLILYVAFRPGKSRHLRSATAAAALAIIAAGFAPLLIVGAAYAERAARLPLLVSYDSRFARFFLEPRNAVMEAATAASCVPFPCAHLTLGNGPWPGLAFSNIWPDWSDYTVFVLPIDLRGSEPLPITIRISDRKHHETNLAYSDRYNGKFLLQPGAQEIEISMPDVLSAPAGRTMDLSEIESIVVFGRREDAGRQILLGTPYLRP